LTTGYLGEGSDITAEISMGNFVLVFKPSVRYTWDGNAELVMSEADWGQELLLPGGVYNVAISVKNRDYWTAKLYSSECLATYGQGFNLPFFSGGGGGGKG
jgi:hypothetical protein